MLTTTHPPCAGEPAHETLAGGVGTNRVAEDVAALRRLHTVRIALSDRWYWCALVPAAFKLESRSPMDGDRVVYSTVHSRRWLGA